MVKPSNKIVLDSTGIHTQTKKVENATTMYAGRLVKRGTNDDDVVVATAGSDAYAWLGYEQTSKKYRPATVDTIYLINAQAAVINGPGIIVVASLKDGETITKGERVCAGASGEVVAATAAAPPSGTVAMTSTSAQATMGGQLSTAGIVVGIAEESKTASGSSEDLLVRSLI